MKHIQEDRKREVSDLISTFMSRGWSNKDHRLWRSEPNQGPFLIDLDIFLVEKSVREKDSPLIIHVGQTYNKQNLYLIEKSSKVWVLVFLEGANFFLLPSVRSTQTLDFVESSWEAHGKEHYNYQNARYTHYKTKIEIFCNITTLGTIHGTFFQKSLNHRRGKGCRRCTAARTVATRKPATRKIVNGTEKFIEKAKLKHGDRYDYSQVNYINSVTEVIIICSIHGPFPQKPQVHLQRSNCPSCAKGVVRNRSDTRTFIKKAKRVHGDRYGYQNVRYVNATLPVIINCSEHGDFQQQPTCHLKGSGCQKCNPSYTKLHSDFLRDALKKHGEWYDYSKVKFEKMKDEIEIGCPNPDHGFFKTTVSKHLSKGYPHGCPTCVWRGNDQESFIQMATEIHEGYYNYDKVVYVKMKAPVIIVCPRHGDFQVTPSNHCRKNYGCKKCSHGNLTLEEFVEKAIEVHGEKYNYSETDYVSQTTPVIIKCDKHNWTFTQKPIFHLRGKGCLRCAHDKLAKLDVRGSDWFIEESQKMHGYKYDYKHVVYRRITEKVTIKCPEHGLFEQLAASHLYGNGCRKCAHFSSGEQTIEFLLTDLEYEFVTQKTFNDCVDKTKLRYDFYVESLNLLIEYDGKQHFVAVDYFGGEKALKGVQRRDAIKNKYAEDNGINLLRIRYDEDICDKLLPFLESLENLECEE